LMDEMNAWEEEKRKYNAAIATFAQPIAQPIAQHDNNSEPRLASHVSAIVNTKGFKAAPAAVVGLSKNKKLSPKLRKGKRDRQNATKKAVKAEASAAAAAANVAKFTPPRLCYNPNCTKTGFHFNCSPASAAVVTQPQTRSQKRAAAAAAAAEEAAAANIRRLKERQMKDQIRRASNKPTAASLRKIFKG
jgi:hypothetical protein